MPLTAARMAYDGTKAALCRATTTPIQFCEPLGDLNAQVRRRSLRDRRLTLRLRRPPGGPRGALDCSRPE